jgi:hypothetical protein
VSAPEQIGFCLHQESTDSDEMRKLLLIQVVYLLSVSLFCSKRQMIVEGFHESRMIIFHEGLLDFDYFIVVKDLQLFKHTVLTAQ